MMMFVSKIVLFCNFIIIEESEEIRELFFEDVFFLKLVEKIGSDDGIVY